MSKLHRISRRHALWLGLGGLAGMTAIALGQHQANHQNYGLEDPTRDFSVMGQQSLGDRARAKGLFYGAALSPEQLSSDADFVRALLRECTMLVPENAMKWNRLAQEFDDYRFEPADALVAFARRHGLGIRGHTLIWHRSLPPAFAERVTSQTAEQAMQRHIRRVARHYAGALHSWDVVNEAVEPSHDRTDGLRVSPWLEYLGPDYIELAFHLAAEADPQARLVYNDYNLDYDTPVDEARRRAVLRLLERLRSRNVPVHALGIQAHLDGDEQHRLNPTQLRHFLREVANLGLKIIITELDVTDRRLPADIARRDRLVASAYEDYLSVVLDEPAVIGVLTWGLSDRYTWLTEFKPRRDRRAVRPLPLDVALQPKLAWNAIARAFDHAPSRS